MKKETFIMNIIPRQQYWKWVEGEDSGGHFQLDVKAGDPFIVEQFCALKKDKKGDIYYEPDLRQYPYQEKGLLLTPEEKGKPKKKIFIP
jgi:hypothetical protein